MVFLLLMVGLVAVVGFFGMQAEEPRERYAAAFVLAVLAVVGVFTHLYSITLLLEGLQP